MRGLGTMTNPVMVNLKSLPYGGAHYVISSEMENFVKSAIVEAVADDCLMNTKIHTKFLEQYLGWIQSSKLNTFVGLEKFPISAFSAGTTEAFDKFYLKNSSRRLRYFKGEYMYHQVAARQYFDYFGSFLEDDALDKNDCVVISLPFSDTGGEHPDMKKVLQQCDQLNIPVLVDCAYFGICSGIKFDLNHPSITDITFSLSKSFPVPHLRIGMRLTRTDDDDSLLVMNKTDYVNRLSVSVGTKVLENFGPDDIYNWYHTSQELLCKELSITPSNCVIFGIDLENAHSEYNRGGKTNRLCLSKYLTQT